MPAGTTGVNWYFSICWLKAILSELVTHQLDYLYFACGLAYFMIAMSVHSIRAHADRSLPWQWITLFAVLSSISCWFLTISFSVWGTWVPIVQIFTGSLALVALIEFGRRTSNLENTMWQGTWIYAILLAPAICVAFFNTEYVLVSLKVVLGAAAIFFTIPVMLRQSRSPDQVLRQNFKCAAVLLTGIIILQCLRAFFFTIISRHTVEDQALITVIQWLLMAEIVLTFFVVVNTRNIYNVLRQHTLDSKLQTGYKHMLYLIMVFIIVLGFIINIVFSSLWERELRQDFASQASVAALSVNSENILKMTGTPADIETAEFKRLYEQQQMINRASHLYRWTYLLLQKEGQIIILTDADDAGSPGQADLAEYTDAPPEVSHVFATREPSTIGPYTDQWGRWLSALAPVVEYDTGRVVAVQGIDIPASSFFNNLALKRLLIILSIWILAMLGMVYYYLDRRLREQLTITAQSEDRYSAIVKNALDGIVIIQDSILVFANQSALNIFSRTEEAARGRIFTDIIHPDDRDSILHRYNERISGQLTSPFSTCRIVRPDGEIRYVEVTGTVIDYGGQPADLAQIKDITDRKVVENELDKTNQKLERIIDSLPDPTFVINRERRIMAWNKAMESMTGASKQSMIGKGNYEYSIPLYGDRRPGLVDLAINKSLQNPLNYKNISSHENNVFAEAFVPCVFQGRGAQLWVTASLLIDESGNILGAIETLRNVTERKELEQKLQASNEKLTEMLEASETKTRAVSLIGEMVQWIDSCNSMEEATAIAGRYLNQLFNNNNGFLAFADTGKDVIEVAAAIGDPPGDSIFHSEECWGIRLGKLHICEPDGKCQVCQHFGESYAGIYIEVPLVVQGHPLGLLCIEKKASVKDDGDDNNSLWLSTTSEIAVRTAEPLSLALANTRLRATLREQANRDPLTMLHNRRYMEDALARELRRAGRKGRSIGFIMIDIDHFKHFNDKYGHEAGDLMLKSVADKIRGDIRMEDIACRYGGEEFLVIMPSAGLQDTYQRARHLHAEIAAIAFDYEGQYVSNITSSMGVSAFPDHGDDLSGLISVADRSMYQAKREGRNRICLPSDLPVL